jgi:hypothetical protein
MELGIEGDDPGVRSKILALHFRTVAKLHRLYADAAEEAGQIYAESSKDFG